METRGRRGSRASGPIATPAEPPKPIDLPAVAESAAVSSDEPWTSAETLAEVGEPAETMFEPVGTVATSVPSPSVRTLTKTAKTASADELACFGRDAFGALAQSQAALARGLEALSVEMAGLALSGIDTAARAAAKMLGVKTLSDAIDVNTGFACSSLDALVGGSAKLSELGVKLATETSQPFLTQFGKDWIKASRVGS
jgi:hypothetical protein